MVIKVKGRLKFEPEKIIKKHVVQDWKKVAMIMIDCDIDKYYTWFLKKRFRLNLLKNLRQPHVTIISDKMDSDKFKEAIKLFDNKEITFYYEVEPRTNTKHWWLRVHCPEAEAIREAMGLSREPYFGFHLTIGYVNKNNKNSENNEKNERNIKHSEYILNTIKLFDILSSEPRAPLNSHQIISFD